MSEPSFASGRGEMSAGRHVLSVLAQGDGWSGVCDCGWQAYGSLDVMDLWQEHTHQDHQKVTEPDIPPS